MFSVSFTLDTSQFMHSALQVFSSFIFLLFKFKVKWFVMEVNSILFFWRVKISQTKKSVKKLKQNKMFLYISIFCVVVVSAVKHFYVTFNDSINLWVQIVSFFPRLLWFFLGCMYFFRFPIFKGKNFHLILYVSPKENICCLPCFVFTRLKRQAQPIPHWTWKMFIFQVSCLKSIYGQCVGGFKVIHFICYLLLIQSYHAIPYNTIHISLLFLYLNGNICILAMTIYAWK